MSHDVLNGLLSLLVLVASGLAGIAIKWLQAKYGTEKVSQFTAKAETVVGAAEQMGAALGWDGAKKKQYAVDLMVKLGLGEADAEAFVEKAVSDLVTYGSQLKADPDKAVSKNVFTSSAFTGRNWWFALDSVIASVTAASKSFGQSARKRFLLL